MDENASSETRCKNPHCTRTVAQVAGGHRKREYCNDTCRQAAHRYRVEQAEREHLQAEIRARWTGLLPATQQALEDVLQSHGPTLASRVAVAVRAEISHAEDVARQLVDAIDMQRSTQQAASQNIAACQEKLTQAGCRISKLEQQVEVQRQRLGWYYQRLYPSSLAVAEERLLALGAALGYKRLLKYNDLTVEVASGVEAWREFATHANIDDLSLAIEQAQRFYENLEATRSPAKRDNQVDHG